MSYCRWSTDCFRCDVYAYADVSGVWAVHVASLKRDVPLDWRDPLDVLMTGFDKNNTADIEARMTEYRRVQAALDKLPLIELSAPSAGRTFYEPSLEAFKQRMLALRAEGLRFPDQVFRAIDDEISEEAAA